MSVQIIRQGQSLTKINYQPRSRYRVYLVTDRHHKYAFVCQSLPRIARLINGLAKHEFDRVSVPSLYEAAHKNGWHKRLWHVQTLGFDAQALDTINDALANSEHNLICGSAEHYVVV